MWYFAIIWNVPDTPDLKVSKELEWDANTGILENVPFIEGGNYSLNIALFYDDGYAYSEYIIVTW